MWTLFLVNRPSTRVVASSEVSGTLKSNPSKTLRISAGVASGAPLAILVYENEGYAIVNLRVDEHDDPMGELWRIFNKLYPLAPYYRERPDNPTIGRVSDWAKARGITS